MDVTLGRAVAWHTRIERFGVLVQVILIFFLGVSHMDLNVIQTVSTQRSKFQLTVKLVSIISDLWFQFDSTE